MEQQIIDQLAEWLDANELEAETPDPEVEALLMALGLEEA